MTVKILTTSKQPTNNQSDVTNSNKQTMKWYIILILALLQFVIVVIAGVIIHFLESDNEWSQSRLIIQRYNDFKSSNPCLSNGDTTQLYNSFKGVQEAGLRLKTSGEYGTSWDYQSSIYTALQIASNVGFGSSGPMTTGGRGFVMCYAILGIPIFVVVVFGMGEQLLKVSDWIRRKFWNRANYRDSGWVHLIRSILLLLIGFLIFSVIFGAIFCAIDSTLNYGQTLSIISIVFTGPGEFMPGENNETMFKSWYRLVVGIWTVSSVIWFSGIISTTRRIILIYYSNSGLEVPSSLDENKNKTRPLTSVVEIHRGSGLDKTTSVYHESPANKKMNDDVMKGYVNTVFVG